MLPVQGPQNSRCREPAVMCSVGIRRRGNSALMLALRFEPSQSSIASDESHRDWGVQVFMPLQVAR